MTAGGSARDAVGVCAHEMGDPQLALFLCHLLEGPHGQLQRELLTRDLLPGELQSSFGQPPRPQQTCLLSSEEKDARQPRHQQFRALCSAYYLDGSSTQCQAIEL